MSSDDDKTKIRATEKKSAESNDVTRIAPNKNINSTSGVNDKTRIAPPASNKNVAAQSDADKTRLANPANKSSAKDDETRVNLNTNKINAIKRKNTRIIPC